MGKKWLIRLAMELTNVRNIIKQLNKCFQLIQFSFHTANSLFMLFGSKTTLYTLNYIKSDIKHIQVM